MNQNKYFLIGIAISTLLHIGIFFILQIKIPKQYNIKKTIYIKTINKKQNNSSNKSLKQAITKKINHKISNKKHNTHKLISSQKQNINYNLTIPSFEKLSQHVSITTTNKKANKTIKHKNTKSSHYIKPQKEKTQEKSPIINKPQHQIKVHMRYKQIDITSTPTDLISYMKTVFKYIHQNCKGKGVLFVILYRDGSLNIKNVSKDIPNCPNNMQAPPMPNSIMENEIQFLINIP